MAYAPIPMVPGPVTVHPEVLLAMNKDFGSGQIDEQFLPLYHATGRNLARILGTANDVVLMSGEGMLALWAGLKSCLQAGDAVVSVGVRVFGDGIGDMAASFGCRVERISLPYNSTIDDLSLVEDAIRRVKTGYAHRSALRNAFRHAQPAGCAGAIEKRPACALVLCRCGGQRWRRSGQGRCLAYRPGAGRLAKVFVRPAQYEFSFGQPGCLGSYSPCGLSRL